MEIGQSIPLSTLRYYEDNNPLLPFLVLRIPSCQFIKACFTNQFIVSTGTCTINQSCWFHNYTMKSKIKLKFINGEVRKAADFQEYWIFIILIFVKTKLFKILNWRMAGLSLEWPINVLNKFLITIRKIF